VVVINDIIILGVLAMFYYLCYSFSPITIIPNAGLDPIYLTDLSLGDITLNATTMSTSRTDLPLTLASAADLNLTSTNGQNIALSSGVGGTISLNNQLSLSGSTLLSGGSGALSLVGPQGISLSSSGSVLLTAASVTSAGPLSVGGLLSAGALSASALTVSGAQGCCAALQLV
jgi:hypothetical protein